MRSRNLQSEKQYPGNSEISNNSHPYLIDPAKLKKQDIEEKFNIMNWNNHKFSYIPYETSQFDSTFINNDPDFQFCLGLLKGYNKEIQTCKENHKEIQNGPWKSKFYGILQNLLWEIVNTKDDRYSNERIAQFMNPINYFLINISQLSKNNSHFIFSQLQLQKNFIKKVQQWTIEQLAINRDPKKGLSDNVFKSKKQMDNENASQVTRLSTQQNSLPLINRNQTYQSQSNISFQDEYEAEKSIKTLGNTYNENMPSVLINKKLEDYRSRARTQHEDENSPEKRQKRVQKQRLKFFKRKQFNYGSDKSFNSQILNQSDPNISIENKQVLYPKPKGYLPPNEEDKSPKPDQLEAGLELDGGDILDGLDEGDDSCNFIILILENEVQAPIQLQNIMIPDKKPFIDEDLFKKVKPPTNKDPRSTYQHYVPSTDMYELKMEQKWYEYQNKQIYEKRADEELIQFQKQFALVKQKISQDINNKVERMSYGQQYSEVEYRPRKFNQKQLSQIQEKIKNNTLADEDVLIPKLNSRKSKQYNNSIHIMQNKEVGNQNIIDFSKEEIRHETQPQEQDLETKNLEYKIAKKKISSVKQRFGSLLNIPKTDQERPQILKSLSVYGNEYKQKQRAFSSVLERFTPELVQEEQLKEIEQIKQRLAKHKVNVPIKYLMNSMLVPDGLHGEKLNNLPEPGQGLLENPFFDVGKKKKKKK